MAPPDNKGEDSHKKRGPSSKAKGRSSKDSGRPGPSYKKKRAGSFDSSRESSGSKKPEGDRERGPNRSSYKNREGYGERGSARPKYPKGEGGGERGARQRPSYPKSEGDSERGPNRPSYKKREGYGERGSQRPSYPKRESGGERGQDRSSYKKREGGGYKAKSASGYGRDSSDRRPRRRDDSGTKEHYRHEEKREPARDFSKKLVATCALGLELTVGRELEALGLGPIKRDNAQVSFPFSPLNLAKANYWLRTADRVWLQLAEFACRDFEELFQGVKAIEWQDMLPQDACFPVEVISTKSKLESLSSCQSVSKKAVVDKLRKAYGTAAFPEIGALFSIRVFIVNNRARVFIDTSGEGLHRRGYRTYNAKAPLRETVAAALVLLSHWTPGRELYDPLCGSGTILLEAACIGLKKAAGVERSFASQRWKFLGRESWEETHAEALDLYDRRGQLKLFGSDNDGQVLQLARTHLEQSGLEGRGIYFQTRDVAEFSSKKKYGVVITNPPYGRRMSSEEEVEELTRTLARVFEPMSDTWSLYYYTAFEKFAEIYGRDPDRVRKIYNGRIVANLLQYPGPKPTRLGSESDLGGTEPIRKRIPLSP